MAISKYHGQDFVEKRKERNAKIYQLFKEGVSKNAIAERLGLSSSLVNIVIRNETGKDKTLKNKKSK